MKCKECGFDIPDNYIGHYCSAQKIWLKKRVIGSEALVEACIYEGLP